MKQKIVFEYDNDNINNLIYVDYNLLWDCLPKTMIAGIYFLWNEHKEILYIGKSTNCIRQRLASHLFKVNDNEKEWHLEKQSNYFYYSYLETGSFYCEIAEIYFIKKFSPKYNVQYLKKTSKFFADIK